MPAQAFHFQRYNPANFQISSVPTQGVLFLPVQMTLCTMGCIEKRPL